jgi:hypothetical protein
MSAALIDLAHKIFSLSRLFKKLLGLAVSAVARYGHGCPHHGCPHHNYGCGRAPIPVEAGDTGRRLTTDRILERAYSAVGGAGSTERRSRTTGKPASKFLRSPLAAGGAQTCECGLEVCGSYPCYGPTWPPATEEPTRVVIIRKDWAFGALAHAPAALVANVDIARRTRTRARLLGSLGPGCLGSLGSLGLRRSRPRARSGRHLRGLARLPAPNTQSAKLLECRVLGSLGIALVRRQPRQTPGHTPGWAPRPRPRTRLTLGLGCLLSACRSACRSLLRTGHHLTSYLRHLARRLDHTPATTGPLHVNSLSHQTTVGRRITRIPRLLQLRGRHDVPAKPIKIWGSLQLGRLLRHSTLCGHFARSTHTKT